VDSAATGATPTSGSGNAGGDKLHTELAKRVRIGLAFGQAP
jgi:hypothetical protein